MAAQDAELKLKVSLDLGFFRQQLAGLGQAAAGYNIPVQVKFDRRSVQDELNALGANIRRRNYRLEIKTNLETEIKNAKDLAAALNDIARGSTAIRGASARTSPKGLTGVVIDEKTTYKQLQALYRFADQAQLPFEKLSRGAASKTSELRRVLSSAFSNVGDDVKSGIASSLKNANSELARIGKDMGSSLLKAVKSELGISSPSKEFKKVGEDSGEGFEQGLKSGLGEATRMGIQEMRELFRALQKEAASGTARLQATMLAAMAGIVQLPGGRQQRGRLAQTAAPINAAMTGRAAVNIGARQAGIRNQAAGAASATPAFMTALPMMFGMGQRELMSRLQGLYGQQYRAPSVGGGGPNSLGQIIQSLAGTRGALGTGGGAIGQLFAGGAVNPGVSSSGYIGRSALSPKFVNYPPGIPAAYGTGFVEPTAFGSLAAGTIGRYGMGGAAAFPSSPMMRGGIGAGGGSFLPMDAGRNVGGLEQSLAGLTQKVKEAAMAVSTKLMPTFGDLKMKAIDINKSVATSFGATGGYFGGAYVNNRGGIAYTSKQFPTSGMATFSPGGIVSGTSGGSMGRFPMAGMAYPSSPLGVITAQSSMFGGGGGGAVPPGGGGGRGGFGGAGGFSSFGRALGGINLPGAGTINELGQEFAFATKQVLLFGQAYKLLSFFQDLPGQVGAAVSQLQSFENTLKAVTPSAQEAKVSNEAILSLVEKYNVPLQSARDGFTKLYASMAPAGFGGDQIRDLFTGVTKAAATFGLSADKVDRVNYAFAQMASKGQVMSEELKGQLGDVLPGAMAIFAQAAGYEGENAIKDFSEALEAGTFKGQAMVDLLNNVSIVLNAKFAKGAEGASQTFQGAINNMQTSLQLFYQSFEPIAGLFLNSFVTPVADGLKVVADGLATFFNGATAQTAGGFAIAQELESLRPAFEGIRETASNLLSQLGLLAQVALNVTRALIQIAGNPVVGFFAQLYLQVLLVSTAFKALAATSIVQALVSVGKQILALTTSMRVLSTTTVSTKVQLALLANGANGAGLAFSAGARQATVFGVAIKAAFGATVIGAIVIGIGLLVQKFAEMGQRLDEVRAKALGAVDAIRAMSLTEARAAEQGAQSAYQTIGRIAGRPGSRIQDVRGGNDRIVEISERELKQLETLGAIKTAKDAFSGRITARRSDILSLTPQAQRLQTEAAFRQTQLRFQEKEAEAQLQNLKPISPGEGAGKGAAAAAAPSLESYENLQDQIAKARTEGDLERAKLLFEYQVGLDRRRFELQESAANEVQKAGIKLAKELFEIETDFRRQALESRQAIVKQEGSVAPGNLPPRAPKGRAAYGPITQFGAGANANLRIGQQVGGADMQPRPVSGSERRDIVAAEKTQQTILTERLRLEKEVQALAQKYAQTISTNFDVIFPVAQLKLQNELLAARYQLELQAVPKEAIDAQLAIAEAEAKAAEQREVLSQKLAESTAIVEKYLPLQEEGVKLTTDQSEAFINAQAFIAGYGSKLDEIAEKTRGFTEAQLENAIANIKQADSLKALEEISGRINSAVEGVTGTFKGLVKEIVTGTDAVDALKKAQEALADQALTMFLDFAFKPVEDFFKNALGNIFNVPNEEAKRKETLDKLEEQLKEQQRIRTATEKTADNTSRTGGAPALPSGQTQSAAFGAGGVALPAGLTSIGGAIPGGLNSAFLTGALASGLSSQDAYGAGTSATSFVDTSALDVAKTDWAALSENVDTSLSSVVESVNKNAKEASESGKTGAKWQESLGKVTQGIGIAASSILGIYAGISQIKEGGTGNVLSGIGSVLLSVAGGIGGIASLFPAKAAAKGAVWNGGFSAFANGGMVKGPTLGLVGEGMYNEAIVPLPDGRSIPVQLNGGRSARDVMGNGPTGGSQGLAIDMKFETTKINGVEYVSREQLEQAMAETRKKAARDGATQGSQLALNKIKNSPSTRRQLGM